MIPTIEYLRARFDHFNGLVFAGRLDAPVILLCQASSFVAQYRLKDSQHQLRFSTSFNLSEEELDDTLIHEMIHYFISFNGLRDRSSHGPLFKALMQAINETHGRNITITRRTSRGEMAEARTAKKKWHVIAILHFSDGKLGVKVLPRVIPKIVAYYKDISSARNIKQVDLYLHNDPYFNLFPTSVGRRCHSITPSDIALHLKGAHTLEVKGSKVIQK